jgi:hypothetical protein
MTQGQFEQNEMEYEDLVLDDEDIQEEDEVA